MMIMLKSTDPETLDKEERSRGTHGFSWGNRIDEVRGWMGTGPGRVSWGGEG